MTTNICYPNACSSSRNAIVLLLRVSQISLIQTLHNDLCGWWWRRLLLETHHLAHQSTWLGQRTFSLWSAGVFGIDQLRNLSVIDCALLPPHDATIGSLVAVRKLSSVDRTRQQMWQGDDQEGDSQCSSKERARRARSRVEVVHLSAVSWRSEGDGRLRSMHQRTFLDDYLRIYEL